MTVTCTGEAILYSSRLDKVCAGGVVPLPVVCLGNLTFDQFAVDIAAGTGGRR